MSSAVAVFGALRVNKKIDPDLLHNRIDKCGSKDKFQFQNYVI